MKFKNNDSAVQKEPARRKLLTNKGCTAQASRYPGVTEVEPPKNATQRLRSLTYSTNKMKCLDHSPSTNKERDYCHGNSRQVGASLKNREGLNDHFVQPCIKKRKLDVIHDSLSGGRHVMRLDGKHRKLTGGKVVEAQSTFPMGIKHEKFPSHEASTDYLLNTSEWNRSKNSEFGKMNNISELRAQQTGGAIESAAENSCSSVSSSESFDERNCMPLGKCSYHKHLPDMIDRTSYPLDMKREDNKITSGGKQTSEVHELESLAYRSVLNALYVRGPLGWHQELLLTDLRLSLHISNDEHRLELTNMCSVQDVQL